ncbi:DUF3429 domain-containing protein [Aestuariibacter sp. AA17]|uniref:DUF3429 domain-containing protein n=1 Tax=Fluctibacter corallii TaxID=2984329 RepID=A0ABT3A9F1_9ALTE|nr:DUF3429 domain-containing protein [Aestuariibacter sp. AA17]MCV2885291.1 DUF3429 domain-containing protein [Aestuariibacter sp. AA17]
MERVRYKVLGYLGLIPFILLPLAISLSIINPVFGETLFFTYSAIILSFLGGVHWYDSLQKESASFQPYFAMAPSLVGWVSITFLNYFPALITLSIAYIMVLIADKCWLVKPDGYMRFRGHLTFFVVLSQVFMMTLK